MTAERTIDVLILTLTFCHRFAFPFSSAFVWGLLKNWDSLLENITLALRTLSVDPENDILIKAFDHLTSTFKQSFSAIVNV